VEARKMQRDKQTTVDREMIELCTALAGKVHCPPFQEVKLHKANYEKNNKLKKKPLSPFSFFICCKRGAVRTKIPIHGFWHNAF
jgi:hypothetical protein